jgi:hypothetical protein
MDKLDWGYEDMFGLFVLLVCALFCVGGHLVIALIWSFIRYSS